MLRWLFSLFAAVAALVALGPAMAKKWQITLPWDQPLIPGEARVYFSPKGGCADAIVRALGQARKRIRVQAYSFTNAEIARALVNAHRRGVEVSILLDRSRQTEKYSSADFVARAGLATWIDGAHAIAHDKVILIDEDIVITGSFNFTKAAEESNAENLLILKSAELATKYLANWESHRAHSVRYTGDEKLSRK